MNSEFEGDVTRMIRSGAVSKLHGNSAWEIRGRKVREWASNKGFQGTPTAGGDPSNNSRAERCVGILKRMGKTMLLGSGLLNRGDLWPLATTHAPFRHRCSVQGLEVSWPRWSAIINRKTSFF